MPLMHQQLHAIAKALSLIAPCAFADSRTSSGTGTGASGLSGTPTSLRLVVLHCCQVPPCMIEQAAVELPGMSILVLTSVPGLETCPAPRTNFASCSTLWDSAAAGSVLGIGFGMIQPTAWELPDVLWDGLSLFSKADCHTVLHQKLM